MGGGRVPGPIGVEDAAPFDRGRASSVVPGPVGVGAIIVVPGGAISTTPLLTKDDVEALSRWLRRSGQDADHEVRLAVEDAVIRIGNLPTGFPRELLHRYIFGDYSTLFLSPTEFVAKVGPVASVIDPNRAIGGSSFEYALLADLVSKVKVSAAGVPISTKFWGKYEVGAFHGAHNTGGLGRFTLVIDANVEARSETDWRLEGSARLRPEKWDFDWTWENLANELRDGGLSLDRSDLRGRQRRTALGSTIPGQAFYVAMTSAMRVSQTSNEEWAAFSA